MSNERTKKWASTRAGLLEEARLCELKGVSKLRKDELVERLNDTEMASKKGVKCRGWTDGAIDRLLGEPDKYAPNPHYKSAEPMRLYRLSRVQLLEETAEFKRFQERKLKRRSSDEILSDRFARFRDEYGDWESAIPDACECMFNLNRYAKHRTCSGTHKKQIYELKNGFIHVLYQTKYLRQCWLHVAKFENVCRACGLRGIMDDEWELDDEIDAWEQDIQCWKCDDTGIIRNERTFYCFRFEVKGNAFVWHQPKQSLTAFTPKVTDPPKEWGGVVEEKPLTLPKAKLAEAKALVRWVIDEATLPKVENVEKSDERNQVKA